MNKFYTKTEIENLIIKCRNFVYSISGEVNKLLNTLVIGNAIGYINETNKLSNEFNKDVIDNNFEKWTFGKNMYITGVVLIILSIIAKQYNSWYYNKSTESNLSKGLYCFGSLSIFGGFLIGLLCGRPNFKEINL
jgi:hypothetical protein